jgi:DGQHR domain-containing protein
MTIPSNTLEQLTTEVLQRESQERQALSMLLDKYTTRKDKLFVQSAEMGGTESYLGAVTLEWFAERVRFASQLPLFREKIDPDTKKVVIDKDTVHEVLQRPIDYSRQAVLAQYLAARPKHKFPPVLVVINQPWVDNREADEWDADGRALRSAADFTPLDSSGKYGNLDVSEGIQIFALDGQHRLLGVKGLMDLIKYGRLPVLDKSGKEKSSGHITIEDLEDNYGIRNSDLQQLGKELIGVEFISAVVPGESRLEAKRRVRSIFVHVNKMASPLTAGQLHQLDDDNGYALVAKSAATNHTFLSGGDGKRVNWENNTISTRSTNFTTLQALTEMARGLLGEQTKYRKWGPSDKGLIPMRPDDVELDEATSLFNQFINNLQLLPSVVRAVQGTSVVTLRNFEEEVENGEGNLLFRPVGQTALATAIGVLLHDGGSLDTIFLKVSQLDAAGRFSGIDKPGSIWYGVLYDPNKKRMQVSGEKLAVRLLVYLLGGGLADEALREDLRSAVAEARGVDGVYRTFSGDTTKDEKAIVLPNPV